jgi:hypothetical protein
MSDRLYAVGVDSGGIFWIVLTVRRAAAGDVYVNFPRDPVLDWKPHASYHASGQQHQKSFGKKFHVDQGAKPDQNFVGPVNMVTIGLAKGEAQALGVRGNPADFNDILSIPETQIRSEKYRTHLSLDLVEIGQPPRLMPGIQLRLQAAYKDAVPWIVVTFYEHAGG